MAVSVNRAAGDRFIETNFQWGQGVALQKINIEQWIYIPALKSIGLLAGESMAFSREVTNSPVQEYKYIVFQIYYSTPQRLFEYIWVCAVL